MDLSAQLQELKAAQGDPALLALASVELAHPGLSLGEREATKDALLAAAVPHWFDPAFLGALLVVDDLVAEKLFVGLEGLTVVEPFPARGERTLNVHESTRLSLREHLRLKYPQRWQTFSERARSHVFTNPTAHARIEALHHLFAIDQDAAAAECEVLGRELKINPELDQALSLSLQEIANAGWLEGAALIEARLVPLEVRFHRGETPKLVDVWAVMELAEGASYLSGLARAHVIEGAIHIRQSHFQAAHASLQKALAIRETLNNEDHLKSGSKEDLLNSLVSGAVFPQSQLRPKDDLHTPRWQHDIKAQDSVFDIGAKRRELLDESGFTPARQQSSDEGFGNNYNIPVSLVQFRRDIQQQIARETQAFLELVQRHTESQLCSLFLIDDDGYLKCQGFYGFDSQGVKLSQNFFLEERYSDNYEKSAVAQAVKPDKSSRYGKSLVLNKTEINNRLFIDQENRKIIEQICGELTGVVLTPVNGPNRSYGVIRIMKTNNYSNLSSSSTFTCAHVWYLELAASQLAANLREINSSQKQALISFMNRANLGILGARTLKIIDGDKDKPADYNNMNNSFEILEYITNIIEHLAHSRESCVKAATLRVFSTEMNGLVTIAASSCDTDQIKDTRTRFLTDIPRPLVIKVYEDGLDCTITDLQKELETGHESNYNLQNLAWLRKCNFKSLICLAIKVNEKTIGTLTLYNGHKQVIANRDKTYFRIIADSLSEFISIAFFNSENVSPSLEQFIDRFTKGDLLPSHIPLKSFRACYSYYSLIEMDLSATDYQLLVPDDPGECILELDRILHNNMLSSKSEEALARLIFNSLRSSHAPHTLSRFLSLRHYNLAPKTIKYISNLMNYRPNDLLLNNNLL